MALKRILGVLTSTAALTSLVVVFASVIAYPSVRAAEERHPEIHFLDHYDRSPALRDIAPGRPTGARHIHDLGLLHAVPSAGTRVAPLQADPVLQAAAGPLVATTAGLNFAGVGTGDYGFVPNAAPPDTNGAVGASQYVQWVNESFAVFNKTTGALVYGPAAGNTLWSGFGGLCETDNDGDPVAQYDKAANRWVMTQFAVTGANGSSVPYLQCVAVSTTSDATGTWNRYAFPFSNFPDYPKLAAWPDAYYFSFNMFSGNTFVGAQACALDRGATLSGSSSATIQCFQLSSSFGGLLPSDLDGSNPPPTGSPNYFLNFGTNSLNLWKFHVDFATPANSSLAGPTTIPVAAFTEACSGGTCIPQAGTRQQLDSLADRLMYRLAYRHFSDHEALVVNHSVAVGSGSSGIRWYELRDPGGTPTVYQQGTYAPDSNYRWMGSVAMDSAGDIAVGYSVSSNSMFPAIRYTGRTPADPLGTLQAETSVIAGGGSQLRSLNRWGDYSAMAIDPADDCTFFYTNEYLKSSGTFNWSTQIASFKFPGCGTPPAPDFSLSISPSSATVTAGTSASYTTNITPTGGFTSAVALSISGLPAGASGSFNPNPASGTSALTVTTSTTTPVGSYVFTVTGTSGSLTHTSTGTLVVQSAPSPDFSLSISPSSVTVPKAGATATYTISLTRSGGFSDPVNLSISGLPSGTSGSFSPNPANGSSSTLTVVVSSSTARGTYALAVTGVGTPSGLTRTATATLVKSRH